MADITNTKNFSYIIVKKKYHMIFGTLEDVPYEEKIRIALYEFKKYHEKINETNYKIYLRWREAQENDWCFSDDLRIVQVLLRNNNGPKSDTTRSFNKGYIRTCVGVFPINPTAFMDTRFELHPNRYSIGQSVKYFTERIALRQKLTAREEMFCIYVANGMDLAKAYKKAYQTNNIFYASMAATRLLQQERIQSAISEEVEDILTQEGVSKSYIVQKYKKLIDDGLMDLKNCSSSVRAALRDLSEISSMFPSKTTQKQTIQSVFEEIPDDRLNAIRERKAQILNQSYTLEALNGREEQEQLNVGNDRNENQELSYLSSDTDNELLG